MIQFLKNAKKYKSKIEVPWDTKQIQKAIDYGKLSPTQYYKKYRFDFPKLSLDAYLKSVNRKSGTGARLNNFDQGMKDLKVFTDELLEYSRRRELVGDQAVRDILKLYKAYRKPLKFNSNHIKEIYRINDDKKTSFNQLNIKINGYH